MTAIGPLARDIADSAALDWHGIAWLTLLPMLLKGLGARRVLLGVLAQPALVSAPSLQRTMGNVKLAQPEEGKNGDNDNDCADDPDNAVHEMSPFISW